MTKIFLPVILFLFLVSSAGAGEIRIFAAASMTDAVDAVGIAFVREHPEAALIRNYAASGTLARQIDLGAPADLFISANPEWMDYLIRKSRVKPESITILTGNSLVFIGRPELKIASLGDLEGLGRIAIGSPQSVPAGEYAKDALTHSGLYGKLLAEGKLVMAKDVEQALIYADRGEVDGAFVYATDALLAKRAALLLTVPAELHPRIVYPMALTNAGSANPEAREFFEFLQSPECRAILGQYGFTAPLPADEKRPSAAF